MSKERLRKLLSYFSPKKRQKQEKAGSHARPLEDFTVEEPEPLEDYVEERGGKQLKVHDMLDTGSKEDSATDTFSGSHPREMFENAQRNPTQPLWMGYKEGSGAGQSVTEIPIQHEDLFTHVAVFGSSGFGKSTTLKNFMVQLGYAGYGFMFVDPNGQDVKDIIRKLPEHRLDDIVYIEPGNKRHGKQISMNFLELEADPDSSDFETELTSTVEDLIEILRSSMESDTFGATMENVVRVLANMLLQRQKKGELYSLLDMWAALEDEEYRERIPEFADDAIMSSQVEEISEYDDEDLKPLLKRFTNWVLTPSSRDIISSRKSDITISEIVEEDKIVLLSTNKNQELGKMINGSITRKLWNYMRSRDMSKNVAQANPYFVLIDEISRGIGDSSTLEGILSQGRKYGLSLTISSQFPNQVDPSLLEEVENNVDTFMSFSVTADKDARLVSNQVKGLSKGMIQDLDKYKIYAEVTDKKDNTHGPVPVKTFPDYPPLRSEKEAELICTQSVEKYGSVPRQFDEEKLDNPLKQVQQEMNEKEYLNPDADDLLKRGYEITDDGDLVSGKQLLHSLFNASLQNGGPAELVNKEQLSEVLENHVPDNSEVEWRKVQEAFVEKGDFTTEGVNYVDIEGAELRLAENGISEVFPDGTGTSGSSGTADHRRLLRKLFRMFTQLGYHDGKKGSVTLPEQGGSEDLPDGLVIPPYQPYKHNREKDRRRAKDKLEEQCPKGTRMFGIDEIAIEAESTTTGAPAQILKNVKKAMDSERFCAIGVKDGYTAGDDSLESVAQNVVNQLTNPEGYKQTDEYEKHFYNHGALPENDDGKIPLIKRQDDEEGKQIRCRWYETEDSTFELHLSTREGVLCSFGRADQIMEQYSKYPYYYKKGSSTIDVYKTSNNEIVAQFDSVRDMKDAGYKRLKQPFIPDYEFERYPELSEDYAIIIVSLSDETKHDFYIYQKTDNGFESRPIFTSDASEFEEVDTTPTENNVEETDEETEEETEEEIENEDETEEEEDEEKTLKKRGYGDNITL